MKTANFVSEWSGSPLVVAPHELLEVFALPENSRAFLANVGLPSNALWFDSSSDSIMCFDSIACLRELAEKDVAARRAWETVSLMGRMAILGVYRSLFIVANTHGNVLMVNRGSFVERMCNGVRARIDLAECDPEGKVIWFANQSVISFAECLNAYRKLRAVFEVNNYDFSTAAIREAVGSFRRSIVAADDEALANHDNYWARILDDVDVW